LIFRFIAGCHVAGAAHVFLAGVFGVIWGYSTVVFGGGGGQA